MLKVQLSPQDARNISQNTMYKIIKTDQFEDSAGGLKDGDISAVYYFFFGRLPTNIRLDC